MQTNLTGEPSPVHLGLVMSQMPGMMWATDRDLRLTYVHRGIPTMHARPGRLVSLTIRDVVEGREARESLVARHLAALAGQRQSFRHSSKGHTFEVVIDALRDAAGAIAGCVGAAIELTRDAPEADDRDACHDRLRRETFLSDATQLLLTTDLRAALRGIAALAVPHLGEECAIDLVVDDALERVAVVGVTGAGASPLPAVDSLSSGLQLHAESGRTRLVVPLLSRRGLQGALTIAASPHQWADASRDLAQALALRLAMAIDRGRLYDEARDAARSRDEFLSIAAHEIRGALTSMRLAVQGLLRGSLSATASHTALQVIQREDRRLGRFVDDLVDLARLRTGQLHFELADVDLGGVVRDVVSRLTADLPAGSSTVTVMTAGGIVGRWDRGRLEQAVTNLLSNALKYGNGQPIGVTAVASGGVARVTVTDRGIGIERAMLARIFNPFQRGVQARNYGGLGLGLHIVKTIVEQFGGAVSVDSRPGAGSSFTLELPIAKEH